MNGFCLVPLPLTVLEVAGAFGMQFGSERYQKELRGLPEGCWGVREQLEETQHSAAFASQSPLSKQLHG